MIQFIPTHKQYSTLTYLFDNETMEILYGGAAASGKSYLGSAWILMMCLKYPGTRYVISRSRLNVLKRTTIKTLQDIVIKWGIEPLVDYHLFNNSISFKNGSEILLLDLFEYPSDPDFTSLGSLELTSAYIDEASELSEKSYRLLKTRLRYKLTEYNIVPKLLITSNPNRGWLYNLFFRPYKNKTLDKYKRFIPALPTDNPYLDKNYLTILKNLPSIERKRLYEGDWEFELSDYDLFKIEDLYEMFENIEKPEGDLYITADIANVGKDNTVIMIWKGLTVIEIHVLKQKNTNEIVEFIKTLKMKYNIKNVIVDSVGVGVGVKDNLKCDGFISNSKPSKSIYYNLKAECYYKLSDYVSKGYIKIYNHKYKEEIIDELIFHKKYNADQDGKMQVTKKEMIKRSLGRSPDFADSIIFRMYYEIKRRRIKTVIL
jgi:phage terminase large subunit